MRTTWNGGLPGGGNMGWGSGRGFLRWEAKGREGRGRWRREKKAKVENERILASATEYCLSVSEDGYLFNLMIAILSLLNACKFYYSESYMIITSVG